ncbi:hypothetical protein GH714_030868 [Hevea brasiliensis]|uniref:Uncharacterized protein n=1 Tax=Hevea brasiliensis TaxID=3981 RepID=A0A6A6K8J0_HEVBR|nr:hypothetical protein GH714_030868 [Hevea brasiliensis]
MLDSRSNDDGTLEVPYTPVVGAALLPVSDRDGDKAKKYDLEDLRKTPNSFYVESGKKAVNGYSFVRTPSPAPGVDESPFITWGEIEGTPLSCTRCGGPLIVQGWSRLRERSKIFHKPPLPSPARVGSASPSVSTLSPTAQKFMRNAISKSPSSVDESLRSSYRRASPGVGTPKSGRSVSRFGRDGSMSSRSPSVREDSNPPW